MSGLINKAKNAVHVMFDRAGIILDEKGYDKNSFELQFACYRSYNSPPSQLLQASTWSSKPEELRTFMNTISASGGRDWCEAVEVGLQHANYLSDNAADIPL